MIHHQISIYWKERHRCHLCSCCSQNWEMKWPLNLNKPITFACHRWLQETTEDKMWHWWSLNWWQVWKGERKEISEIVLHQRSVSYCWKMHLIREWNFLKSKRKMFWTLLWLFFKSQTTQLRKMFMSFNCDLVCYITRHIMNG